jgi:hypothetical protein
MKLAGSVILSCLLGGCAANKPAELSGPGRLVDVGILTIAAAPADTYPVEANETYRYPDPWDDHLPPAYPESLLAQRLPPVRLKLRAIVDEGGRVTQTTLLDSGGAAPHPAFVAAARATVGAWAFTPLVRLTPAPGETTTLAYQGITHQFTGKAVALPFHQDYEFTFTQRDGIGFVTTQAPR